MTSRSPTQLFAPKWRDTCAQETRFGLDVCAQEPYLDHHRPGGDPLFSTAMGVEALVAAVRLVTSCTAWITVSAVRVLEPYLAVGGGPHTLEISVKRLSDYSEEFDCLLFSAGHAREGGREHLRLQAAFTSKPADNKFATTDAVDAPCLDLPVIVSKTDIYQAFFHGPAFQVVDAACYQGSMMRCRLNTRLTSIRTGGASVSEFAPLLVEFALQSAGLLELTSTGRIMIPYSIGRIDWTQLADVNDGTEFISRALFAPPADAGIDVDIFDAAGRLAMRVCHYRTKSLPFPVDSRATHDLRAKLLRVSG